MERSKFLVREGKPDATPIYIKDFFKPGIIEHTLEIPMFTKVQLLASANGLPMWSRSYTGLYYSSREVDECTLRHFGIISLQVGGCRWLVIGDRIVGLIDNDGLLTTIVIYDELALNYLEKFEEVLDLAGMSTFNLKYVKTYGDAVTVTKPIPNLTTENTFDSKLYANLLIEPTQFAEKLRNSKNKLCIFYGSPGTGKSEYAKMVATVWSDVVALAIDSNVYGTNNFYDVIASLPDGTLVILEEADQLLSKKSNGNETIPMLLSLTSGMAERNIKFIVISNMSNLNNVESAVLRSGRLAFVHNFKPLPVDLVKEIREERGLAPLDYEKRKAMSLADAISDEAPLFDLNSTYFGFN